MTNYLPTSARRSRTRRLYWLAPVLVLALLYRPIVFLGTRAIANVGKLVWPIGTSFAAGNSTNAASITALALARAQLLESENRALRRALGQEDLSAGHLATVISSVTSSPYDTFVIDQGEDEGLAQGQVVVSEGGVALGEVVEVYSRLAKVQLYSAYGRDKEVVLEDGTHTLASGSGSQNFFLKLPRGLVVHEGEYLHVPEEQYIVGVIERVEENPGDAFVKVYARSPINIFSLARVYVIQ